MPTIAEGQVVITVEQSKLDAAMSGIPRTADVAAKKISQGFSTEFNKISGAAANLGEKLGGPFAKISGLANGALKPLAELGMAMGPAGAIGIGAAAAAVSLALVGAAAVKLANDAEAARDRLDAMGMTVGGEAKTDLDSYAAATRDLSIAMDNLRVALGSDLAGELALFARAAADGVTWVAGLGEEAGALAHIIGSTLAPNLTTTVESLGHVYTGLTDTARAAAELEGAMSAAESKFKTFGPSLDAMTTVNDRWIASQKKAADAAKVSAAADDKRRASIIKILQLDAEIDAAMEAEKKKLESLAIAGREYDAALQDIARDAEFAGTYIQNMITEETAEAQKEKIKEIAEAALFAAGSIASSVGDIFAELMDRQVEAASQVMDANAELRDQQRTISQEILRLQKERDKATTTSARNAAQQRIDELVDQKEAKEQAIEDNAELAANRRKHAMQAFIGNKFAAVSGIGIQTALGIMNAMATVPWPAAPFVAAGVGVMGATQAGIALAQQPPEFPMGRSPDHAQIIAVQPGEPTLPRRAARDLGADTIRHLQEGRGGGGNVFVLEVDGREVAAMVSGRGRVKVDRRAGKSSHGRR